MSLSPKRHWLVWIFLIALVLRVGVIFVLDGHHHGTETAHHDHRSVAKNLATGHGFRFNFFGRLGEPVLTSQQAPLVPGLLAGWYLLLGVETPAAFLGMLLLQSLVSSLTVVGLAHLSRAHCESKWCPIVTGLLAAGYPPLVVSSAHVQALVWNLWWLTLLLLATQLYRQGFSFWGVGLFVASGTGGLLTDPILAGVVVLLLLLLAIESVVRASAPLAPEGRRKISRKTGLIGLTSIVVGITLAISPWIQRNYRVHGRLVPIKDSFFYVLWQGNNSVSLGTDKLLVSELDAASLAGIWNPLAANRAALQARGGAVSVNVSLSAETISELQAMPTEIQRMDRFRDLALAELSAQPGRYFALCVRRLWFWIWFDPTNPRSYPWPYRIGYLTLLALALPGLWLGSKNPHAWLPIYLAAAALTAVHVLVITSARFRIPLELLLLLPAGLTLTALGRLVHNRLPIHSS